MIGTRVEYRGSIDDAYGLRFVIAEKHGTGADAKLTLATYDGHTALRNVRPSSVAPVPAGPRHQVRRAEERAQVAQGELARNREKWLPYIRDHYEALPATIRDLIRRKRPVEAEYWLLQAERFVDIISHKVLQARLDALVIAGHDESWLP